MGLCGGGAQGGGLLHIAIAKPDFGVQGGFEKTLGRIARELESRGHEVTWLLVDARTVSPTPFGVDFPDSERQAQHGFLRYLALVEEFQDMDTSAFDVVLSNQPPSFALSHPRHLSLFYHHERSFYDLNDAYLESGRVDRAIHEAARPLIRAIDNYHLHRVSRFLAGSPTVAERLRVFNGVEGNVDLFHSGTGIDETFVAESTGWDHVICVSRQEFTKRMELFVHAMKYVPTIAAHSVGTGGLLPYTRALDQRLSRFGVDLDDIDDRAIWLHAGVMAGPDWDGRGDSVDVDSVDSTPVTSNITFHGHVSDETLAALYAGALCVVAPAYLEDYGLTAIEAMAWGKPLIVCRDGGGLADLVDDGVTGLIVAPTGRAIADAVQRLQGDRDFAIELGRNGREVARQFTWERSMTDFTAALAKL